MFPLYWLQTLSSSWNSCLEQRHACLSYSIFSQFSNGVFLHSPSAGWCPHCHNQMLSSLESYSLSAKSPRELFLICKEISCILSRSAMSKVSSDKKGFIINKLQKQNFGLGLTEQLSTPLNISMHILQTVLYRFPKVMTRRICLTIKRRKELLQLVIIPFILMTLMFDSGVTLRGEIRCYM